MNAISRFLFSLCLPLCSSCLCGENSQAADLKFERIVIDNDFPGAYQVEIADVNGDTKPDIVAVGGSTCAWYENPTWKKRIISGPKQTPAIISSATTDLDGDGKAEVAIAYDFEMNEPKRGKLLLMRQGSSIDDPWTKVTIDEKPGKAPASIHRLRWAKASGGRKQLVAAPLFGDESKPPTFEDRARIRVYYPPAPSGFETSLGWGYTTHDAGDNRPVLHAIEVRDVDTDGLDDILAANNLGVTLFQPPSPFREWKSRHLVDGAPGEHPKRGSSEIHLGELVRGKRFLATIEPWHGSQVAIYMEKARKSLEFGARTVIDDTLDDGHGLWVADIDGDGNDEIFAGHRGKDHRVSMYRFDGTVWNRTVLDTGVAAQDLRGADTNTDGFPGVVAVGGSTHNVIWYKPLK